MKSIGIIAEYNPLHQGHVHQLRYLKENYPYATRIIIMSGSFVQRGEPAFFSKFLRAQWAILGGADVVIELPALFAVRSAEVFAGGALRLLQALHIDSFSFGSELNDLTLLEKLAILSEDANTQAACRNFMQKGLSYRSALTQALSTQYNHDLTLEKYPNAILALEYLKAKIKYNIDIKPLLIHRISNYHDATLTNALPSATALRLALKNRAWEHLSPYFPSQVFASLKQAMISGQYLDHKRYEDMILYQSRLTPIEELSRLGDFYEGLEHRWKEHSMLSTWAIAREEIKTKRYSFARLDRISAYVTLKWDKELLQQAHKQGPCYGRILAFNENGRYWLKNYSESLPLINKWGPFFKQTKGFIRKMCEADISATNLQSLCFHAPDLRTGDADFSTSPLYVKN